MTNNYDSDQEILIASSATTTKISKNQAMLNNTSKLRISIEEKHEKKKIVKNTY